MRRSLGGGSTSRLERQPGLHLLAGAGLGHFARLRQRKRRARRAGRLLPLHAVEERRHAVVVVLRPALERMVVALGTLQASAKEHLRDRLDAVVGVGRRAIEVGRRVLERAALCDEQLAGELVVGHVAREGPLEPAVILVHAVAADLRRRSAAAGRPT